MVAITVIKRACGSKSDAIIVMPKYWSKAWDTLLIIHDFSHDYDEKNISSLFFFETFTCKAVRPCFWTIILSIKSNFLAIQSRLLKIPRFQTRYCTCTNRCNISYLVLSRIFSILTFCFLIFIPNHIIIAGYYCDKEGYNVVK